MKNITRRLIGTTSPFLITAGQLYQKAAKRFPIELEYRAMLDSARLRKLLALLLLGLSSIAVAYFLSRLGVFQTLELRSVDYRFRSRGDQGQARRDIVLVDVDELSLRTLEPLVGRWPWPRNVHATLIDYLNRAPAKLVVFDVMFTERDADDPDADLELVEANRRAGNVVHAALLGGQAVTEPDAGLLERYSFRSSAQFIRAFRQLSFPIPGVCDSARAVGHVAMTLDSDGPWRRSVPLARYKDRLIPSLPLAAAIAAQGLKVSDLSLQERTIRAGTVRAELDEFGRLPTWYNGPPGTYKSHSYAHLLYSELQLQKGEKPGVDPSYFHDRIVIVGTSAAALHDLFTTPYSGGAADRAKGGRLGQMMGAEVQANILDNLLSNRSLHPVPSWMTWLLVSGFVFGLLGCILYLSLPVSAPVALVSLPAYVAFADYIFSRSIQMPVVPVVLGSLIAVILGYAYQYWIEGAEKRRVKQIFSRYVSRDVYQELLNNPKAVELGGTRRLVTVLFSDIRGFTTISESQPPELLIAQLNEYFSAMVEIVFEHRGTVDKFVGDMVMAIFNAPIADPLHADQAVRCAIAMNRRLLRLNEDWAARRKPSLRCGVGINSGDMIVGNVGSESIRSYTVIGDNVNLGARLESLCKEYKTDIIISDQTRALLSGEYRLTPLGDVVVKGKSKPVAIYSVDWND